MSPTPISGILLFWIQTGLQYTVPLQAKTLSGGLLSSEPFYTCGQGKICWTVLPEGFTEQRPEAAISLRKKDRAVIGIVSLDYLSELLSELSYSKGSYFAVIDNEGMYISHPKDPGMVGKKLDESLTSYLTFPAESKQLKLKAYDGVFLHTVKIPGVDWQLSLCG